MKVEGGECEQSPEMVQTSEEKAVEDDVPLIEELTEEEAAEEMKRQNETEKSPEEAEDEVDPDDDFAERKAAAQAKIIVELDGHETIAKKSFERGDYQHSFNEYKAGLKACSDLILSNDAKQSPELKQSFMVRRRKFCVNCALVCIKVGHFSQGLEACTLVLAEGPDNDMQRVKALYRSGLCAQGMGELEAAKQFFTKILEGAKGDDDEDDSGKFHVDPSTIRDVKIKLRNVNKERKQYKKFAREMCNPTKKKNLESIIIPEKKVPTEEELEQMAEVEEKRKEYVEKKRRDAEYAERSRKEREESEKRPKPAMAPPEIVMSEEDCTAALDTLIEEYSKPEVQKALRDVCFEHVEFSEGYIIRSKKILAPIQKGVLEKYGFLNPADCDDDASIANTDPHTEALRKFQLSVRYLARSHEEISKKADECQQLALGNIMIQNW